VPELLPRADREQAVADVHVRQVRYEAGPAVPVGLRPSVDGDAGRV